MKVRLPQPLRAFVSLLVTIQFAWLLISPAKAATAIAVGRVEMVRGGVILERSAIQRPLRIGEEVYEGDRLLAAADSLAYVTLVDDGYLSLRAESSVRLVRYRYNAQNPEQSEIRIDLEKGVARFVTGQGAKAARERFRMNTPIAAIGVRGTDFTVYADDNLVRATASFGHIVVSAFGPQCQPTALGPCSGLAAVDLRASERRVAQLMRSESRPQLLDGLDFSPDRLRPPATDERPAVAGASAATHQPTPVLSKAAPTASSSEASPAVASTPTVTVVAVAKPLELGPAPAAPGSKIELELLDPLRVIATPTPPIASELPTSPSGLPAPVASPPPFMEGPLLEWGRWRDVAGLPANTTTDAYIAGLEKVVQVGPYILGRKPDLKPSRMPSGTFSFALAGAEAVAVHRNSGVSYAAQVQNPSLSINFSDNTFKTHLELSSARAPNTSLDASGRILSDGTFRSDDASSNGLVRGLLAGPQAEEAAYLFDRLAPNLLYSYVGSTRWRRQP